MKFATGSDGIVVLLDLANGWTVGMAVAPCGGTAVRCVPTVQVFTHEPEDVGHVHDDALVLPLISEVAQRPPPTSH